MKTLTYILFFLFEGTSIFAQYQVKYENEAKSIDVTNSTSKVFKDNPKDVVITDFKVTYRMFKGEAIQGSSYSPTTNASYGTSATMNVIMKGVTKDDLLKNTNEIYSDFVKDLTGKGYKVETLDAEKIKGHKKFAKDGNAKILNGESFEYTHKSMLQAIAVVPSGVNAIEMKAPEKAAPSARGGGGATTMGEAAIINDLLAGREVIRLSVSIVVDFVDFTKKGKTLSGAPLLHIGGEHTSSSGILFTNKKMIMGTYNATSNKPVYIEETDWAGDMNPTTDLSFMGSKLKNYEMPVNVEKYSAGTKALAKGYLNKYFSSYESFVADLSK